MLLVGAKAISSLIEYVPDSFGWSMQPCSEFCVQMLAQARSRLMSALVGQHSASPAAAPQPRLAVALVDH